MFRKLIKHPLTVPIFLLFCSGLQAYYIAPGMLYLILGLIMLGTFWIFKRETKKVLWTFFGSLGVTLLLYEGLAFPSLFGMILWSATGIMLALSGLMYFIVRYFQTT